MKEKVGRFILTRDFGGESVWIKPIGGIDYVIMPNTDELEKLFEKTDSSCVEFTGYLRPYLEIHSYKAHKEAVKEGERQ